MISVFPASGNTGADFGAFRDRSESEITLKFRCFRFRCFPYRKILSETPELSALSALIPISGFRFPVFLEAAQKHREAPRNTRLGHSLCLRLFTADVSIARPADRHG